MLFNTASGADFHQCLGKKGEIWGDEKVFSGPFIQKDRSASPLQKSVKAQSPAETRWEVLAKEAADSWQGYRPVRPRVRKHNKRTIQPFDTTGLFWAKSL